MKNLCLIFLVKDPNINPEKFIEEFKETQINCQIGIYLNSKNAYLCDDIYRNYKNYNNVLFFVEERDLSPEQRFHLSMFFEQLSRDREYPFLKRLYFTKMSEKFGFDLYKKDKCFFMKRDAMIVESFPIIKFCPFDKSFKLLDLPYSGNQKNFEENLKENKKKIKQEKCTECSPFVNTRVGIKEICKFGKKVIENRNHNININKILKNPSIKRINGTSHNSPHDWRKVMITGWYGTETIGDKAILGETVYFIKERSPNCQILITTLNKKVSLQTKRELDNIKEAEIIDIEEGCKEKTIEQCDAVIFGGGPIMQSNALVDVWKIFKEANRQKKARIIFGCGFGPFHTEEMERIACQILQMSTKGFFRDGESLEYAKRLFPDINMDYACDPSIKYLTRMYSFNLDKERRKDKIVISTLLRANTREFINNVGLKAIDELNKGFALKIADFFKEITLEKNIFIQMLAMNCHYLGGDDRNFNRMVEKLCGESDKIYIERAYMTIDGVIKRIKLSDFSLAMRYHGHLFSFALQIPFLSINYTGKDGKVANFLRRIAYEKWSTEWSDQNSDSLKAKIFELMESKDQIKNNFYEQKEKMLCQLEEVYEKLSKN